MILRLQSLALGAIALSTLPLANALSAADIASDIPVSKLISSATTELAKGNGQDALAYFDAAITRDPQNYLTIFRRGAAYLQLGKSSQASHDFDKVLAIKPGFEGALVQRAKIRSRSGNWAGARKDYQDAGKSGGQEIHDLDEAEGAAKLAAEAEKAGDWVGCTSNADIAILVAGADLDLRRRRAHCRFEKGDVLEGISDMLHIATYSSGSSDAHMQISSTTFYAFGERDNGLSQVKKCLHSDPDSKPCSKMLKREKKLDKRIKEVVDAMGKRKYSSAVKELVPGAEDAGLLKDVLDDYNEYKTQGLIHKNAPSNLYNELVEMTCEAYTEVR